MRLNTAILLKGGLGASLALNLVLGGLLWSRPAVSPPGPARLQARIERILPDPDRQAFHRAMQAGSSRYEPAQTRLREGFAEVQTALQQQPFDPARLRQAMGESRARWGEFSRVYDENLANGFSTISPEGRALVAQDMARGERDTRKDGRRGGDRPERN